MPLEALMARLLLDEPYSSAWAPQTSGSFVDSSERFKVPPIFCTKDGRGGSGMVRRALAKAASREYGGKRRSVFAHQ
jgi:hypothetical protein